MAKRKKTLDELADKIESEAKKGNDRLLATAMLVRELRLRIQAGEAGIGVKWIEWAQKRFGRGKTWLNELNAIANSEDPKGRLALYRERNCERQKRFNDSLRERDPERNEVIKLIKSINIEHVRKVRKTLHTLTGL